MNELTGAAGLYSRRKLDFYPTPNDVTQALLDFLRLDKTLTIWEPACGSGKMSQVIENNGYNVVSTDIAKECYGEAATDYLTATRSGIDAIITNPPFALSESFIKKAKKDAPIFAFLLKSQYWHARKRLPLFNQYQPTYLLPLTWRPDFLNGSRGGASIMEVFWCVWLSVDRVTKYIPLSRP